MYKYLLMIFVLFSAGCGGSSYTDPAQDPSSLFTQATDLPPLVATDIPPVGVVPENVIPTSQESLFADLGVVLFRDDFDDSLDAEWNWVREDAGGWSLTAVPGSLLINVGPGHINLSSNSNLLLREVPSGNFILETKVVFQPLANYQFAGLVIYESPSSFVQVGRAFCEGTPRCVGDGFYMDYYEGGSFVAPNYAEAIPDGNTVFLQLIRRDATYSLKTSLDGEAWTLGGTTTSYMTPLQIGLVAGQNTTVDLPAAFDYFEISTLP